MNRREVILGLAASVAAAPVAVQALADGVALTSAVHPLGAIIPEGSLTEEALLRMMVEVRTQFLGRPYPRRFVITYEEPKIVLREISDEEYFK